MPAGIPTSEPYLCALARQLLDTFYQPPPPCTHLTARLCSLGGTHQKSSPIQLLLGLDQALSSVTGLHSALTAASPSSSVLTQPGPNTHHQPPLPYSHGEVQQPQQCTPIAMACAGGRAFTVSPDPCCLPWLPPLHVCLQLASATTQALVPKAVCSHITSFIHHHCLHLSRLLDLVAPPRNPATLTVSVNLLQHLPGTTQL